MVVEEMDTLRKTKAILRNKRTMELVEGVVECLRRIGEGEAHDLLPLIRRMEGDMVQDQVEDTQMAALPWAEGEDRRN